MYSVVIFLVLMLILGLFFALVLLLIGLAIKRDTLAYDNEFLWRDYALTPKQMGFKSKTAK